MNNCCNDIYDLLAFIIPSSISFLAMNNIAGYTDGGDRYKALVNTIIRHAKNGYLEFIKRINYKIWGDSRILTGLIDELEIEQLIEILPELSDNIYSRGNLLIILKSMMRASDCTPTRRRKIEDLLSTIDDPNFFIDTGNPQKNSTYRRKNKKSKSRRKRSKSRRIRRH